MGYRSDVRIVFYPERLRCKQLWPLVKLWVQENWPDDGVGGVEYDDVNTIVVVSYDDVKWYDGFDYVTNVHGALEKFMESFESDEQQYRASYEFARTGEELNDIETYGTAFNDCRLGVMREMVIS
jgi:hypothetical protein